MTEKEEKKASQYISYVLRHNPESCLLTVHPGGWVDVGTFLKHANANIVITREILERIVANDEKNRYSFRNYNSQIRANQGHSFKVDLQLEVKVPPKYLLHGTAWKNLKSILEIGIHGNGRNFVHLTESLETALEVGSRHGSPVILTIDAKQMCTEGYHFYQSENGVWLTEIIPSCFISIGQPL